MADEKEDYCAAAARGELDDIKYFLEDRLEINVSCADGKAALHFASYLNFPSAVEGLLEVPEVEVNIKDVHGFTPLMFAAAEGNCSVVKKLLDHCDIRANAHNIWGTTALMMAARNGQKNAVVELLRHPFIDAGAKDRKGLKAKHHAWNNGHMEICHILTEWEERDQAVALSTQLLAAVTCGDNAFVSKFLNAASLHPNPSVSMSQVMNLEDESGFTPLQIAAYLGNEHIVAKLLSHPAVEVNKCVKSVGCTALMLAGEKCHFAVIEQLMKHPETQIQQLDYEGRSVLDYSAQTEFENFLKLVLPDSESESK